MNTDILKILNISKSYGNVTALKNLSLNILGGQVFGLLGPNGSGKTTTLSIVMEIIKPDAGSFEWFGESNNTNNRKKIGTLIETPNFYPFLSAKQNLEITARIKEIPSSDIERVLKITGLLERKNHKFGTFSLGMKQRLAISAALLGNPEVLIFDEPANGLDPQGIADIREIIINEAKNGKTIIMASHILDEVEKVCTNVAILKKGQLIKTGKIHELLNKNEQIFLSSDNNNELFEFLVRSGICKNVKTSEKGILVDIQKPFDSAYINKFCFENGFSLKSIEAKTQSLEEQYLELINK